MVLKKSQKIKIGFDLDGVLIDHKKNRMIAARRLGYRAIPKTASVADFKEILPVENYRKVQRYLYGKATLKALPMADGKRVLGRLSEIFEMCIISRRQFNYRGYGRQWLKKHLDFPEENIFFAVTDKEKGRLAKKLGVKIFLDDKISVLNFMPKGIKKFLFDEYRIYKTKKIGDISVVHNFMAFLREVKRRSGNFSKNRIG